MKKLIAILAILMLVPFTAFGLEALSEDVLDDVTGQAGVSIAADIMMDITMDTLAWGDSDGIDADNTQTAGWVGLKNLNITDLRIRLNTALIPTPGAIRLFTIDVATDAVRGTYVHMLLGSQHITMASMTTDVELGSTRDLGSQLGTMAMFGFDMVLNGDSYVDISAHGGPTGAGVTLDFDITVETIDIASCAWGDRDGLGADPVFGPDATAPTDGLLQGADTTVGGFVGLAGIAITNLTVTGQVMIDVCTLDTAKVTTAGAAAGLVGVYASMLAVGYDGGTTGVLIRLNDINFGIETFQADVVLAATNDLTGGASTLGSIWMDNLDVNVNGWVGIFAH